MACLTASPSATVSETLLLGSPETQRNPMTSPVPHRKHTIENAARVAVEYNLTVRLEPNGAVTFIPANHNGKTVTFDRGLKLPATPSLSDWLEARDNEGAGRGDS